MLKLKLKSKTTFATENKLSQIIQIKDTGQLSQKVIELSEREVKFTPVSAGMNYGYGNCAPKTDNEVLLDLTQMNSILEYDDYQGYIRVEAGVTFKQVYEYLSMKGGNWILAGTGAPPNASLVGNLSQRGIGKGLSGSRGEHSCNYEVVLKSGDIINTGMGKYSNSTTKNLSKYSDGPSTDGIYIQSDEGIITAATFWLDPKPSYFETFIYTVKDNESLGVVIDKLHELKMKGIIRSNLALFNDYRILGLLGKYPWDLHDGKEALPRKIAQERLAELTHLKTTWYGEVALFCHSKQQAKAYKQIIKKALRGHVDNLVFFNQFTIPFHKALGKFVKLFKPKSMYSNLVDSMYTNSGYLGVPMEFTLASCYFRKPDTPLTRIAPIEDNCGLYWVAPVIPFEKEHVNKAVKIVEDTIMHYGLEPAITLQAVTSRQVDMVVSISFDRDIEGADEVAKKCHDDLLNQLMDEGYYPYRHGLQFKLKS